MSLNEFNSEFNECRLMNLIMSCNWTKHKEKEEDKFICKTVKFLMRIFHSSNLKFSHLKPK